MNEENKIQKTTYLGSCLKVNELPGYFFDTKKLLIKDLLYMVKLRYLQMFPKNACFYKNRYHTIFVGNICSLRLSATMATYHT